MLDDTLSYNRLIEFSSLDRIIIPPNWLPANCLPALHFMKRFSTLAFAFGLILMIFGLTYIFPIMTSLVFNDGMAEHFLRGMSINIGVGGLLAVSTMSFRGDLKNRDGYLLVAIFWLLMASAATLPLMWGIPNLSFTDAFFEAMSGFTTTGATVLVGLDTLAPSLNLWRHELNWIGGLGIIVLAVAILPLLGVGGMQLYKAEIPGPVKDSKLTPRIAETARLLWLIYAAYTLLCMVALKLAGMTWFDAVCHAFSTLSLGGFSTHDASVGYFDSVLIESIISFFMVIAALNFATHYSAISRGSLKPFFADPEAIPMLALLATSILVCSVYLIEFGNYQNFNESLRYVSFNLISIATDAGFASTDFDQWAPFVPWWMLFLSCITVCTGSTGGGIKMFRTLLMWKQSGRELFTILHPRAVHPVRIGYAPIANKVIFAVLAFIFLYFISVTLMTFILIFTGLDAISALSAVLACINNAGPGLNQLGPANNYAGLDDFQTWVCAITMLLGRLEIFTLIVLFTPSFWRA